MLTLLFCEFVPREVPLPLEVTSLLFLVFVMVAVMAFPLVELEVLLRLVFDVVVPLAALSPEAVTLLVDPPLLTDTAVELPP